MRDQLIVTPEALESAFNESVIENAQKELEDLGDPVSRAAFLAALPRAMQAVRAEAATVTPGILFAPQDDLGSRLMSAVADSAPEESTLEPLTAGGLEVKFATNDWWGWFRSVFDHVKRATFHPIARPKSFEPTVIPNDCRIAVLGDWGTGLYGAPIIAQTIKAMPRFDLLIHLGDVYYSGTPKETDERFLRDWPFEAAPLHRMINSNHEMYSGGYAYFQKTLPHVEQQSSYFALANDNWLLIGLDTGYFDHDLDDAQAQWVREMLNRAEGRRVIFFSHHQLLSHFSPEGVKLAARLGDPLQSGAVSAWYWGHEHRCLIYEPDPASGGMLGRCIGHSGMPERRKTFEGLPVHKEVSSAVWRRFGAQGHSPGGIALDGPNPYIKGDEDKYAPHGFAVLEIAGTHLSETAHLAGGEVVYRAEPW